MLLKYKIALSLLSSFVVIGVAVGVTVGVLVSNDTKAVSGFKFQHQDFIKTSQFNF
jgi:hypothetical protein